ncbi:MAG: TRAP transporter permease, partial [Alphaproteobacteria bacterium]|nr:TRAP transporter permease [Alphaproteobacteria bacterium]
MAKEAKVSEGVRVRSLAGPLRAIFVAFTLAAVLLSINQLFNLQLFGIVVLEGRYLFLLAGAFLFLSFLIFPPSARAAPQFLWLDLVLAVLSLGVSAYFAWTADINLEEGWEYAA